MTISLLDAKATLSIEGYMAKMLKEKRWCRCLCDIR